MNDISNKANEGREVVSVDNNELNIIKKCTALYICSQIQPISEYFRQ